MHDVMVPDRRRPGGAAGHHDDACLTSFVRNQYFYGKLLDVHHLEMEQCYLNEKRWLVNRLGLGSGVLCGLEVEADGGAVVVKPGVALDGHGREIVVPAPFRIADPLALTDERGRPTGDRAEEGATLCLAFHECDVEPTPVLVADCDLREECRPGAVRERYRVLVEDGPPKLVSKVDCAKLSGGGGGGGGSAVRMEAALAGTGVSHLPQTGPNRMYSLLCELIDQSCGCPDHDCVPIAVVGPDPANAGDVTVVDCGVRVPIYSNAVLLDLILCLARVTAGGGQRVLRYEDGDQQTVDTAAEVTASAVLSSADGTPLEDESVTFRVRAGGGSVGDGTDFDTTYSATSDANGHVEATWRIGKDSGLNTLEAEEPGGSLVVFYALAQEGA